MKSQFIHIETYSLKRTQQKADAIGVLKEARREESHSKHIDGQPTIKYIHGKPLKQAEQELLGNAFRRINGKAVRKDARILLAGVASYPFAYSDVEFSSHQFQLWIDETTRFLQKTFGHYLQSIVLHEDENYPHLHFYCYDTERMSVAQ